MEQLFGDLLTKPKDHGGMDYGTMGSSVILLGLLVLLVIYETVKA
ncbi:MAG: hypothetical protein WKF59_11220 [Chitinophagaceae bacterium]